MVCSYAVVFNNPRFTKCFSEAHMIQFTWPQFKLCLWQLIFFSVLNMSCPLILVISNVQEKQTFLWIEKHASGNKRVLSWNSSPFLWLWIWRSSVSADKAFLLPHVHSFSHLMKLYILDVRHSCQTTVFSQNVKIWKSKNHRSLCKFCVTIKFKIKCY